LRIGSLNIGTLTGKGREFQMNYMKSWKHPNVKRKLLSWKKKINKASKDLAQIKQMKNDQLQALTDKNNITKRLNYLI
jgi:hypothetical protein